MEEADIDDEDGVGVDGDYETYPIIYELCNELDVTRRSRERDGQRINGGK